MKKFISILSIGIFLLITATLLLNIQVTIKQGINYKIHKIKIPLYLKVLDFYDRHYNYKYLVKRIIGNSETDEERVIKIFAWTYQNIRKAPDGFPAVDDHVWHIIIRGYGTADQSSDVFTTLCNYAGIDAFFSWVSNQDKSQRIPLSFVMIDGKWFVFDPYRGTYFKNLQGDKLADIETLQYPEKWLIKSIGAETSINYNIYFNKNNLSPIREIGLKRANIQSPVRRLLFELKKIIK